MIFLYLIYSGCLSAQKLDTIDISFNPAATSIVLNTGQIEIASFNSIATHNDVYNYWLLKSAGSKARSLNSNLQFTLGILRTVNVGFDLHYNHFRIESKSNVNQITNSSNLNFGPRARFLIFGKANVTIVFQTGILFSDSSLKPSIQINQLFLTYRLSNFLFMYQLGSEIYPKHIMEVKRAFWLPSTFFASRIINSESMIYTFIQYSPEFATVHWTRNDNYYLRRFSLNLGAGLQYRVFRNLNIFSYYSHSIASANGGGFNLVSLGARYSNR